MLTTQGSTTQGATFGPRDHATCEDTTSGLNSHATKAMEEEWARAGRRRRQGSGVVEVHDVDEEVVAKEMGRQVPAHVDVGTVPQRR